LPTKILASLVVANLVLLQVLVKANPRLLSPLTSINIAGLMAVATILAKTAGTRLPVTRTKPPSPTKWVVAAMLAPEGVGLSCNRSITV
jgi:hypothetical protein